MLSIMSRTNYHVVEIWLHRPPDRSDPWLLDPWLIVTKKTLICQNSRSYQQQFFHLHAIYVLNTCKIMKFQFIVYINILSNYWIALMCRLFVITLNFVVLTLKNVNSLNEVITEQKLASSITYSLSLPDGQSSDREADGEFRRSIFGTQPPPAPHSLQNRPVVSNNETVIHIQTSPPRVG